MRRTPLRTRVGRTALGASLATAALAGCTGSSSPAEPSPSAVSIPSRVAPTTPASCPPPTGSAVRWPSVIPSDLPVPPGATGLTPPRELSGGVTVVQFTTPTNLRESVLFVLEELQPAGYTLGRGDAESNEADAPFVKGQLQGVFRMLYTGVCETSWLLAVARRPGAAGGNPLLPPRPGVTPTPLPFG